MTQSTRTPVTWCRLTSMTFPSFSLTAHWSDPVSAMTSACSPSSPCTARSSRRSPILIGSGSSSSSATRDSALPMRLKALRTAPPTVGNLNISGSLVVSTTPVAAAPMSRGLSLRMELIQEDLPTPEPPVTAIITVPLPHSSQRYSGTGYLRRSSSAARSSALTEASCSRAFSSLSWALSTSSMLPLDSSATFLAISLAATASRRARSSRATILSVGPGAVRGLESTAMNATAPSTAGSIRPRRVTRDSAARCPNGPRILWRGLPERP
mmetsp:Transcript_27884/g.74416  ORF Transcript_27884/g.74416 Transcript_27884/m.74416 type:complete len:268 (+) Transcript_27884:564-1367(+)